MLFYLTLRSNLEVICRYLGFWGRSTRRFIQPICYEDLFEHGGYRRGTYLFTDIELLFGRRRERVRELHARLASGGRLARCLNDPQRAHGRLALGQMLHAHGINRFRAVRGNEDLAGLHFPVFLRRVEGHLGPETGLLQNAAALERGLVKYEQRGAERGGVLVVEYADVQDRDGLYRKYSVFNVGGRIIPRHVFFSRSWCQKSFDLVTPALLDEEMDFMQRNPHEAQLRRIFEMAQIDYGRIDYGVQDGAIQVWEINTNPSICSARTDSEPLRRQVHRSFHLAFTAAMRELNSAAPWAWPGYWRAARAAAARVRAYDAEWRELNRALPAAAARVRM